MHKKFFQTLTITVIMTLLMNAMPHQVRSETSETNTQISQLKALLKGPQLSEQQMKQKVIEMGVDPRLVARYPREKLLGETSNNANGCTFVSWLICLLTLSCSWDIDSHKHSACTSCINQLESQCTVTKE